MIRNESGRAGAAVRVPRRSPGRPPAGLASMASLTLTPPFVRPAAASAARLRVRGRPLHRRAHRPAVACRCRPGSSRLARPAGQTGGRRRPRRACGGSPPPPPGGPTIRIASKAGLAATPVRRPSADRRPVPRLTGPVRSPTTSHRAPGSPSWLLPAPPVRPPGQRRLDRPVVPEHVPSLARRELQ